jgi:hypothetical protein
MPRHTNDYAPFRALLSAPYPLPVLIRQPPERLANHPTIQPPATDSASIKDHGFPYIPDWRSRQPAILPIPYPKRTPEEEAEVRENKMRRSRLKRERRMGKEVQVSSGHLEVEDALAPVRNAKAVRLHNVGTKVDLTDMGP